MGTGAQILLVVTLLVSPLCQADSVLAERYRAFWCWSGVKTQPVLKQAQTLYLHQGEVLARGTKPFIKLGQPYALLPVKSLWITVRFETLAVSEETLLRVVNLPYHWSKQGNQVVGLQIDFDAGSYALQQYAQFLQQVRAKLDKRYALGVTGLLDWAKTGSVAQLNQLPIDELVVQTYQGRQTVPGYQQYLPALLNLQIPFKVGLVQGGNWDSQWQQRLSRSSFYRGEVVFLLNPDLHNRAEN
ncbi:MAG: DUF3142 domain-containing protein [Enterobacteriaceae bacterium]